MKAKIFGTIAFLLLVYTLIYGFVGEVPARPILQETIRNLYFHVPMWFTMIGLFTLAVVYSIKYLSNEKIEDDLKSSSLMFVGLWMGVLGLVTGSLWAKYTWGAYWAPDAKLQGSAITLLIYLAYFVLRIRMKDNEKLRGRFAAVYSIIAYVLQIVFIMVYPRIVDSLHPGNGGNPGFNQYDLDNNMRMVFYPAVLGWFFLGLVLTILYYKYVRLKRISTIYIGNSRFFIKLALVLLLLRVTLGGANYAINHNLLNMQLQVQMADAFRAEGKIYVVIGVVLLILVGIFTFLVFLNGRLKKLEKEIESNKELKQSV